MLPSAHCNTTNAHLIEINAFLFLHTMRQRYGTGVTLGTIPENEWERISSRGFRFVWLMGVWERSNGSRECALKEPGLKQAYDAALPGWTEDDVQGSPYAIRSYRIDPRLGTGEDLRRVKDTLNGLGMGLILDFVPNHTALDHPWTKDSPGVFIQGGQNDLDQDPSLFFRTREGRILAHGKDPYFPAWGDTAQVNHFSDKARRALLSELARIARMADGVRCDMAMLVLSDVFEKTWGRFLGDSRRPQTEFWLDAVQETRAIRPQFIFIAEAYWGLERRLQQLGFDFTYDKRLYDLMLHAPAREVRRHLLGNAVCQHKCVRFIENHDEPRAVSAFGKDRSRAAAVIMATVPGMHLFHDGQIEGNAVHMPVQLCRPRKERTDPEVESFYERLLSFTRDELFAEGTWKPLDIFPAWEGNTTCDNLLAWVRHKGGYFKLVCVNYSDGTSQGRLRICTELVQAGPPVFKDMLTDEVYIRTTDEIIREGLYVELGPFKAHLLDLMARPALHPRSACEAPSL